MNTNTNMNTNSAGRPRIVSKITRADMGLALPRLDDKCLNEDGSTDMAKLARKNELIARYAHVYDLGGLIRRAKAVKGKGDQDGVQFVGEFKAHLSEALGGTWFIAGKAHVPKMYEDVLYAGLVNAQGTDPEATLKFLIRVGIKPPTSDKPSMTGYEWTVQTLVDTDAAESPVDLLFSAAAGVNLLAGPEGAARAEETKGAESGSAEATTTAEIHTSRRGARVSS